MKKLQLILCILCTALHIIAGRWNLAELSFKIIGQLNNPGIRKKSLIIENMKKEPCGICKKTNAYEMCWYTFNSRVAHEECFNLIRNAEKDSQDKIESLYKSKNGNYNSHQVHAEIVDLVQKACGDLTILEYFKKNGEKELKKIFDNACKKVLGKSKL